MYDFTILSHKIIFEYDGIHWHGEHTIDKDRIKEELAIQNNFSIIRIRSDWSDKKKYYKINKIIYEKIQINNPDWGII
jgi:very-short-patch-repair endonuclease